MALAFRITVNKKKAVTYCQQALYSKGVHEVFIALFVEYPLCFLLCHNLRLHMLKTCSIGKTVLSVSCARFKSHICQLRPPPPPHFKTKKSLHLPLLDGGSTQISRLYPFSSRRQQNPAVTPYLSDGVHFNHMGPYMLYRSYMQHNSSVRC